MEGSLLSIATHTRPQYSHSLLYLCSAALIAVGPLTVTDIGLDVGHLHVKASIAIIKYFEREMIIYTIDWLYKPTEGV